MEILGSSSATQAINDNNKSGSESNWFRNCWERTKVGARKLFKPVRKIFASKGNKIQYIDDPGFVKQLHDEYDKALKEESSDKDTHFTRLAHALVHSMDVDDVDRGIQLLKEGLLNNENNNKEWIADKQYHQALGYYRCEDYGNCVELLESCIENSPRHEDALSLQKVVEDQIRRDEILCMGCTVFSCCAGILGVVAATDHSHPRYEKLSP